MKRFAILIFGIILCFNLKGQDTAFIYTYGGIQNDGCSQVKATYDNGYIMIGTSNSFGCGNTDFYAIKVDSMGKHVWSKTYGGPINEEGFSVTPTLDKGFAFVGFTDSYGNGGYDVFLVKTDSLGNVQWQKAYGGSDWDFGYSVRQLSDSGFIICGQTYSFGAGNGDVYIIRTNSKGDTLWTRAVGGAGYEVGNSVCVLEDSLYAIVGATTSFGKGDTDMYFILMDDKGIIKKDTTFGSTHNDIAYSINVTQDNGFVIFGSTDSLKPGKPNEIIIKTDSIGHIKWMQLEPCPGIGIGKDAIQAPDGSYVAVSTNNSSGLGGYAMLIWHLNSGGGYLVSPSLGGAADEQGNSVAISKNGNVVLTGTTDSPGYTEGLDDVMMIRWKNADSISFFWINYIKNFYDTCYCIPTTTHSQVMFYPGVKVFPNPVSTCSTLLVQGVIGEHYFFNIYNMEGQGIFQNIPLQTTAHGQSVAYIEKGNLTAGVYMYEIYNQNGIKVTVGKFIVD